MELSVARRLIRDSVENTPDPQVWADLGAGKGLFSAALAGLLVPGSIVYAVDRDSAALRGIDADPSGAIRTMNKDFVREDPGVGPLDGVLMANALHFVKEKPAFILRLRRSLRSGGRIIIVEYDRETATPWVPYPVSFSGLRKLAAAAGFRSITRLDEEPSVFNRVNIYSALVM